MHPPDEGLQPARLPGPGVDLGLVVHDEPTAAQRRVEVGFQCQLLTRPGVHLGVVAPVGVATCRLGPVHRGIGVHEQDRAFVTVGRVHGHPDAHGDEHRLPAHLEWLAQHVDQPPRGRLADGRGVIDTAHQDRELVAAQSSQHALAEAAAEAVGGLAQELVTARMAQAVVDVLEPVEVAEQHRDSPRVGAAVVERLVEAGAEAAPVGQAGERVVVREVLVPRLLAP